LAASLARSDEEETVRRHVGDKRKGKKRSAMPMQGDLVKARYHTKSPIVRSSVGKTNGALLKEQLDRRKGEGSYTLALGSGTEEGEEWHHGQRNVLQE